MRQASCAIIIGTLALWLGYSPARGDLSITLGGNTGVYLMPEEVSGFIDGSSPTDNRYIWTESGTSQYGYSTRTYKYAHPFPEKTLPNTGFNIGLSYTFQGRLGVFIEGCRTFSILDKEISQCAPDTLPGDDYSIIPHDYRIRLTESDDQLYMKSFQFGLGLSYAIPLKKGARIIMAGSFGTVNYSQYFRIETKSITTDYFQNDGNRVYSETNNQGSFEVFGIRYSANCFKPSVAIEWDLRPPLSAHIGLACPVALIEKGVHFTENDYYNDYASIYYPSKRFWTGNVVLSAGIRLRFIKGGTR